MTAKTGSGGGRGSPIYFSIVQRKVLTPNDFPNLDTVAERLLNFQSYYESIAQPLQWKFTRSDLSRLLARIAPATPIAA